MVMDKLLFPDGGIRCDSHLLTPTDTPRLIVGLGGLGIRAMLEIQKRLDLNAAEAAGIRFLGIDSDHTDLALLPHSQQFYIGTPESRLVLHHPELLARDPLLRWLDPSRLPIAGHIGAGGNRAAGRFFLIHRPEQILNRFRELIYQALAHGQGRDPLQIFVLTGLSGGTGSGCLVDLCYLLRCAAQEIHVRVCIHGCLFLPDVLQSRYPHLYTAARALQDANSYAALAELQTLAKLREDRKCFRHQYTPTIHFVTDDAPLDHCFLLSGTDSTGGLAPMGMANSLRTAADYVLTHLTAPHAVLSAITSVPRERCFDRLFSCSMVFPNNMAATETASRLFLEQLPPAQAISRADTEHFMRQCGLSSQDLFQELRNGSPVLALREIPRQELRALGEPQGNRLPDPWQQDAQQHLQRSRQYRQEQYARLTDGSPFGDAPSHSIPGRVWEVFSRLCADPRWGPYNAMRLLEQMLYALDAELHRVREAQEQLRVDFPHQIEDLRQIQTLFYGNLFYMRHYGPYREIAHRLVDLFERQELLPLVEQLLRFAQQLLKDLEKDLLQPLHRILSNLEETFHENRKIISAKPTGLPDGAWQMPIVSWNELREIEMPHLLPKLIETLLAEPECLSAQELLAARLQEFFSRELGGPVRDALAREFRAAHVNGNMLFPPILARIRSAWSYGPGVRPDDDSLHISLLQLPQALQPMAANFLQSQQTGCVTVPLDTDRLTLVQLHLGAPAESLPGLDRLRHAYTELLPRESLHLYCDTTPEGNPEDTVWYRNLSLF